MNFLQKIRVLFPFSFLPVVLFLTVGASTLMTGCSEPEYTLKNPGSSPGSGDAVYPKTPVGKQIKEHLTTMAGVGVDAEANYQSSLAAMRSNPEVLPVLAEIYEALPEEDYFRRTLVVETLKELRSAGALPHLIRVANAPIPEDRIPDNTEINTREDEIVIRITAVQGLSVLAARDSSEANDQLLKLVAHDDLTVRQMAARGFLGSSIGSTEEKLSQLRKMVPKEEHWYLTTTTTPIREVHHPEVLPDFDLKAFMDKKSQKAPKTEETK